MVALAVVAALEAPTAGWNREPGPLPKLKQDSATNPDPVPLWGLIACANPLRYTYFPSGAYDGGPFRRLAVRDGDDYFGERCELGYNSWKSPVRTFYLYEEGMRRVTRFWIRLPSSFPIDATTWQVVMQMKQTQPAAGAGESPIISLNAVDGEWQLVKEGNVRWATPVTTLGQWTRVRFDVTYSVNPAKGKIQVDIGEARSPVIRTRTLKPEVEPGGYGIPVGSGIPSHLRIGVYHDPGIAATHADYADVQVRARNSR